VRIRDALGLGSAEGRIVVPLRVWLPLAVALLVVAPLVATPFHLSRGEFLALAALALVLVVPLATVVTLRRDRGRR
jgi:hypothetical protein